MLTEAIPNSAYFADFQFVPNSAFLTGSIVDTAGRVVTDAWVGIASAVRYQEGMHWGKPIRVFGGTFRIRVPAGPLNLWAWRPFLSPGAPMRVNVSRAQQVTVTLEVP